MTTKDIEEIVAKYTKLIHPQDLGEPTSKLENTLREAFEELTTLQSSRGSTTGGAGSMVER